MGETKSRAYTHLSSVAASYLTLRNRQGKESKPRKRIKKNDAFTQSEVSTCETINTQNKPRFKQCENERVRRTKMLTDVGNPKVREQIVKRVK